jgi:hypothetical protein
MASTPLPPEPLPGYEVSTKHKETIRQLYGFAKMLIEVIMDRYKLSKSGVRKVLDYEAQNDHDLRELPYNLVYKTMAL